MQIQISTTTFRKTFINTPCEKDNDNVTSSERNDVKQEQLIAKKPLIRVWNEIEEESKTREKKINELNVTQDQYEEAHKSLAKSIHCP